MKNYRENPPSEETTDILGLGSPDGLPNPEVSLVEPTQSTLLLAPEAQKWIDSLSETEMTGTCRKVTYGDSAVQQVVVVSPTRVCALMDNSSNSGSDRSSVLTAYYDGEVVTKRYHYERDGRRGGYWGGDRGNILVELEPQIQGIRSVQFEDGVVTIATTSSEEPLILRTREAQKAYDEIRAKKIELEAIFAQEYRHEHPIIAPLLNFDEQRAWDTSELGIGEYSCSKEVPDPWGQEHAGALISRLDNVIRENENTPNSNSFREYLQCRFGKQDYSDGYWSATILFDNNEVSVAEVRHELEHHFRCGFLNYVPKSVTAEYRYYILAKGRGIATSSIFKRFPNCDISPHSRGLRPGGYSDYPTAYGVRSEVKSVSIKEDGAIDLDIVAYENTDFWINSDGDRPVEAEYSIRVQ